MTIDSDSGSGRRRRLLVRSGIAAAVALAVGVTLVATLVPRASAPQQAVGASHHPTPASPTRASGQPPSTVAPAQVAPPVKVLAEREAAHLMLLVELPAGSSAPSSARPAGTSSLLDQPGQVSLSPYQAVETRWTVVPGSPQAALAWMKAHLPAGSRAEVTGQFGGPNQSPVYEQGFVWASTGPLTQPGLLATAAAYGPGETVVRLDAEVVYHPERPASEHVGAGVDRIVVTVDSGGHSKTYVVTRASLVGEFVRVLDSLQRPIYVSNPGGPCLCGPGADQSFTALLYVAGQAGQVASVSDTPILADLAIGNVRLTVGGIAGPALQEVDYQLTRVVAAATGFPFAVLSH